MTKFTVNNKEYTAKPFDFNMICDLEDMGISIEQAEKKPMGMVRAYFGICANLTAEQAGREMEAHIVAGGNLEDIFVAMSKEMTDSDFFRQTNKTVEKKTGKGKSGKTEKAE